MDFRNEFGELNSFVLDSLRGLDETIQYGCGKERMVELETRSRKLNEKQAAMKQLEGNQRGLTSLLILFFSFGMLFLCAWMCMEGRMNPEGAVLCTVLMMGSFGPVVALSGLSNNLMQTLASGERVPVSSGRRAGNRRGHRKRSCPIRIRGMSESFLCL